MFQNKLKVLCAMACVAAAAVSAYAQVSITGTVIDGTGSPVSGAAVKLALAGDNTTTDGSGNFTLGTTGVVAKNGGQKAFAPVLAGNSVYFSVVNAGENVRVDVCDLSGKLVSQVVNKVLPQGMYAVTPFSRTVPAKMYVVRLRIGSHSSLFTMAAVGRGHGSLLRTVSPADVKNVLAKQAVVIDTIIVTKTGYTTARKPIESLTGTQIIILNAIPPATELGIISERATNQLNYANVNIWGWDQATAGDTSSHATALSLAYTGDKEEGTKCCRVVVGNIGWSGWGIAPKDPLATGLGVDMSGYTGGKLHFYIKGTCPSVTVMVTWNVANAANKLDVSTYGYVPGDGAWHLVEIPFADFGAILMTNITYYVAFGAPATGGTYTPFTNYMVDDVTWKPAQ